MLNTRYARKSFELADRLDFGLDVNAARSMARILRPGCTATFNTATSADVVFESPDWGEVLDWLREEETTWLWEGGFVAEARERFCY